MSGDHNKYHLKAEVIKNDWKYDPITGEPLYSGIPKREWVGLTENEILDICKQHADDPVIEAGFLLSVFRTYEDKLKEKNT